MSTQRDALRSAALKGRAARSKLVTFEGIEYEVRAPSVKTRARIFERGGVLDNDPKKPKKQDLAALQVAAMVFCTYVPGTDERVFEDADTERLSEEPAGGIVDSLGTEALGFLNTTMDEAKKD